MTESGGTFDRKHTYVEQKHTTRHANHVHPAGPHEHAPDDVAQGLRKPDCRRHHAPESGAHAKDHKVPQEVRVQVQKSGVPLLLFFVDLLEGGGLLGGGGVRHGEHKTSTQVQNRRDVMWPRGGGVVTYH